jgi:BirA family biotin operon repressor/biotin-[acetyl-CoA-carboxylase] ligase
VIGDPRIHVDRCESTQLLLDPYLPEGTIATASHQTSGRGRLGRRWEDKPGASLLCSVLLKPPAGRHAPELTLVGGLAVAETVESALGRPAQIKWPNDVLVDGAKLSGGLAELRGGAVVLGIGVNVNQTREQLPVGTSMPAASLRTVDGVERDVEAVLASLLRSLNHAYTAWLERGLAALHPRIAERDFLRGRAVTVEGVTGRALGIRPDGKLELDTPTGTVVVESGEVAVF